MSDAMLEIRNLHVRVEDKPILRGVDLVIRAGEVHAVMGPNGSGKSTLAQVLAGREDYEVTRGTVSFEGRDLLAMRAEERARAGLFLGFQYHDAGYSLGRAVAAGAVALISIVNTCNHFHRSKRLETLTYRCASKPHMAECTVANPTHKFVGGFAFIVGVHQRSCGTYTGGRGCFCHCRRYIG